MDLAYYQRRAYPTPPCWHLAAEVLHRECGLAGEGEALRLALHGGNAGWRQVAAGVDLAVVLMSRNPRHAPEHCGIWYQGRVLHATGRTTMWESATAIADRYRHLEFWIHDGHH